MRATNSEYINVYMLCIFTETKIVVCSTIHVIYCYYITVLGFSVK